MKKALIISKLITSQIYGNLKEYYDIVRLDAHPCLPKQVAHHVDMQLLKIGGTLIKAQGCSIDANAVSEKRLGQNYPEDVILNALLLGSFLFANTNSLDPVACRVASQNDIEIVHTKQGYAKCSALVIENGVISADSGIINAVRKRGFDALLIKPGQIAIDGYDYGFIGGASHFDPYLNTVFFYGDIERHENFVQISDFIKAHGKNYISLSKDTLFDYGGAIIV